MSEEPTQRELNALGGFMKARGDNSALFIDASDRSEWDDAKKKAVLEDSRERFLAALGPAHYIIGKDNSVEVPKDMPENARLYGLMFGGEAPGEGKFEGTIRKVSIMLPIEKHEDLQPQLTAAMGLVKAKITADVGVVFLFSSTPDSVEVRPRLPLNELEGGAEVPLAHDEEKVVVD